MAASSIQVRPRVLSWAATLLSGGSLLVALLVALPFQAAAQDCVPDDSVGHWGPWVAAQTALRVKEPGWEMRRFTVTASQAYTGNACVYPARPWQMEYRLIPACAAETCDASCPLGCDDCLGRDGPRPYVDGLGMIQGKYHIHRPARPGGKVCEGSEGRLTPKTFHVGWCEQLLPICSSSQGCPTTTNNYQICYEKHEMFRAVIDRNNSSTVLH